MNTGSQDAYNLGWKLGQVLAGARDPLLDTYEEERLPVVASILGITTKLHRRVLSGNTSEQRRGPETLHLGVNYRGSSLVREENNSSANIHAGDRAPAAPCSNSSGTSTRLFDVFRRPHFTLLAFGACHLGKATEMNQGYGFTVHAHSVLSTDATTEATRAFRTASSILRAMPVERMTRKTACWSWSDQTSMSASSRTTTH
jgi:hypothetical protein